MKNRSQKIIVVTTITILAIPFLFSSIVFAEDGVIQLQIRGAGIGDNLKISAYTFQNSWEWNDTFTISNNLVKQVDEVSIGGVLNLCVINLQEVKEGCSSGTFNSDGIVKINIDLK